MVVLQTCKKPTPPSNATSTIEMLCDEAGEQTRGTTRNSNRGVIAYKTARKLIRPYLCSDLSAETPAHEAHESEDDERRRQVERNTRRRAGLYEA